MSKVRVPPRASPVAPTSSEEDVYDIESFCTPMDLLRHKTLPILNEYPS